MNLAWLALAFAGASACSPTFDVLAFNVLQGGNPTAIMPPAEPRHHAIAEAIALTEAEVVIINEDQGPAAVREALEQVTGREWNRWGGGPRGSSIYSILDGESLNSAHVRFTWNDLTIDVATEHWPPGPYGPYIAQEMLATTGDIDVEALLQASDKTPYYLITYRRVLPSLREADATVLAGDFNEPSHLDWTERYAEQGSDRWVNSAFDTPLNHAVPWKGSRVLTQPEQFAREIERDGSLPAFIDAFREVHPDPVEHPGITWTPPYENGTPGRRMYDADPSEDTPLPYNQVLDRIDKVYYSGALKPVEAFVVGESGPFSDLEYDPWPSDHRAVLIRFEKSTP